MPAKRLFEPIIQNINKCEVRLEKYNLPVLHFHHEKEQLKSIDEARDSSAESKRDSKSNSIDNEVVRRVSSNKGASSDNQEVVRRVSSNKRASSDNQEVVRRVSSNKRAFLENEEVVRRVSSVKGASLNTEEESNALKTEESAQVETDESTIIATEKSLQELELERIVNKYVIFTKDVKIELPKLCMWLFMSDLEVGELLKLSHKGKMIKYIDNKINSEYPKGTGRLLITELLYSVVRFCQKSKFTIMQTGTLLSIFYLTQQFLLGSLYRSVQKVYCFFKEYMLMHCFDCPPDCMKIFNYQEAKNVALYFCTIYLTNIPLIRLLTLPNFGLHLNYEKLPDPFEDKKGKGKK